MAERRMFAKQIVLSDSFLDMPSSARCLYFTLGMFADDDGFVNNPKGIMRQCGTTEDDMKILLAKKFLIAFETGVIVIKHWKIHNYIQKDRYKKTKYIDEKELLELDDRQIYHKKDECIQNGYIGKDRLGKVSVGKDSIEYISPTSNEVDDSKKKENINFENFLNLYHTNCSSLPKVLKLTDERKKKIKLRLKTYPENEWWLQVFEKANKSDFCTKNNWCSLDWLIANDTNPLKVYEGKYDNKGSNNNVENRSNSNDDKYSRENGWF